MYVSYFTQTGEGDEILIECVTTVKIKKEVMPVLEGVQLLSYSMSAEPRSH